MSVNHFTRKAGSGDMDMHTYAPFRQQLNVPFGTHKLQDFIYCLPLKFGIAFDASAQVSELQLAEAPYARRYDGFANTLRDGQGFELVNYGLLWLKAAVHDVRRVTFPVLYH